jgi:aspartyl-tRNA(Asn)/glutamyl-tRNA(Gln) amidotransferase subunit C
MSIGRDDVLHVARLAELAVGEDELDRLAHQLNRIVEYVAQLDQVPADRPAAAFLPGPEQVTLRDDVPGPARLVRPVESIAPEFREGFFLVPRHIAMEEP